MKKKQQAEKSNLFLLHPLCLPVCLNKNFHTTKITILLLVLDQFAGKVECTCVQHPIKTPVWRGTRKNRQTKVYNLLPSITPNHGYAMYNIIPTSKLYKSNFTFSPIHLYK